MSDEEKPRKCFTITVRLEDPDPDGYNLRDTDPDEVGLKVASEAVILDGLGIYRVDILDCVEVEQPTFWGVVYDVTRAKGGNEEGGWWFDTGTVVKRQAFQSRKAADAWAAKQKEEESYPQTGSRYNVNGGEDYDVFVSTEYPPDFFPEETPRYE